MRRALLLAVFGVGLVALGWSLGHAQSSQPDFEIVVRSPGGETTVECVRGCVLVWAERGLNPNAAPQKDFWFKCGGAASPPVCSSGRIGGWVRP